MTSTQTSSTQQVTGLESASNVRNHAENKVPPRSTDDIRALIPVLGLKEYWYPAIKDKRVGWKKPVFLRMLGENLCLFRGKSGSVVALANACPHRGAMLSNGKCEFKGLLSCFYHGFVFDEQGACVAALGEGPQSPMPGKVHARVYPTVTLKGIVFVWTGKGDPAPPSEDIPEEFFDPGKLVLHWSTEWPANWRPCFENSFDSHPRYLHRNSVLMLTMPIPPPHFPLPGKPVRVGKHRLSSAYAVVGQTKRPSRPYQDYYPGLGAKWPRHRWRLAWTWIFDLVRKPFKWFPRYQASDEWETGQQLPCVIRINYHTHMFTRWGVPVDANRTRLFYFHSAQRRSAIGRAYERLAFVLFHNWILNKNFSGQDLPAAIRAYYDTPEFFAPTDAQVVQWRKMVLSARGMEGR